MSVQTTPMSPVPAYDAAERGTLEVIPVPAKATTVHLDASEEKKMLKEKESVAIAELPYKAAAKPAPKPKKKVSKWILWQLWFNTYRSVASFQTRRINIGPCFSLTLFKRIQEAIHNRFRTQHDRRRARRLRTFPVRGSV